MSQKKYSQDHEIVGYNFTVEDLEELTTYGGDELRTFSNEQIDDLSKDIKDAINDVIANFLNHN